MLFHGALGFCDPLKLPLSTFVPAAGLRWAGRRIFGTLPPGLVALGGQGSPRPLPHMRVENVDGHGFLQRICMLFFQKGKTWCGVLQRFMIADTIQPVLRLGGQCSGWHVAQYRLRREPERLQSRTQREGSVAQRQLGEPRQPVESRP